MPASRASNILAAALALAAPSGSSAASNADAPIARKLHHLALGNTLWRVRSVFPPRAEWRESKDELGGLGGLTTYEIDDRTAKNIPPDIERFRLGFRLGFLLYIQAVYTKPHSKRRPIDKTVTEYAVAYGEPRRKGETYFWKDWRTALRVSNVEVPAAKGRGVEMRTSVELMSRLVFDPQEGPELPRGTKPALDRITR